MNEEGTSMKRIFASVAGSAALVAASLGVASAADSYTVQAATGTLTVKAVQKTPCSVSSNNVLDFGTGDFEGQTGHDYAATGTFSITCGDEDGQIALDGGSSANPLARYMTGSNGGPNLNYQLYQDAAHTIV
jgi:spore coat protein U-like protein